MRKCFLAFFALAALVVSLIILQLPAFAELEDTVLTAQDTFTADNDTWLKDYTGGTGFAGGWKSSIDLNFIATELPADWKISENLLTAQGETGWGKSLGQNFNITRQLSNVIDFGQDGEYYIKYKTKATDVGTGCSHTFGLASDRNDWGNSAVEYSFGYKHNNDATYGYITGYTPYAELYTTNILQNNTWYTFVIHISTRATGNDIVQMKAFKDGEEVTYSPKVWDYEYGRQGDYKVSRIVLGLSNGTGSGERPNFDDISIYKGSMIKVNQTSSIPDLIAGQVVNISVPDVNTITNHAQTVTNEWYDCTGDTPLLLSTSSDFTITDSMIGRLIRVKTTVTDTVASATTMYWPVSKFVRAKVDVDRIRFSVGGDQVTAYVDIYKAGPERETTGNVQLIIAKYDVNGNLLNVVVGAPVSYDSAWQSQSMTTGIQMNPCTLSSGEYVKVFAWDSLSGVRPIPVNKNSLQSSDKITAN